MKNFYLQLALGLLMAGSVLGRSLPAELIMGEGRKWQGEIVSRDGDWIEFKTGSAARPVRVAVATIEMLNFKDRLDTSKISSQYAEGDYDGAVRTLDSALKPYAEYADIPSNMARYHVMLMELNHRTGRYDEALAIAEPLSEKATSEAMKSKARAYRVLSLIDSGRVDEAGMLLDTFGWNEEAGDDAAPDELYARAKLKLQTGDAVGAAQDAARVVAFHSTSPEWAQPAELLCAQIYAELGLYESAQEVCRQIMMLYKDSPEAAEAQELSDRVGRLMATD